MIIPDVASGLFLHEGSLNWRVVLFKATPMDSDSFSHQPRHHPHLQQPSTPKSVTPKNVTPCHTHLNHQPLADHPQQPYHPPHPHHLDPCWIPHPTSKSATPKSVTPCQIFTIKWVTLVMSHFFSKISEHTVVYVFLYTSNFQNS